MSVNEEMSSNAGKQLLMFIERVENLEAENLR